MSGKWLVLLKEIAPRVKRTAVLRDPAIVSGIGQFGAVQAAAPSLGVELSPVDVRDVGEMSAPATLHRDQIITLAARHRLPAVYPTRYYAADGGLISCGPDLLDQYRRAAGYVDRIVKGGGPPTFRYRRRPSLSCADTRYRG